MVYKTFKFYKISRRKVFQNVKNWTQQCLYKTKPLVLYMSEKDSKLLENGRKTDIKKSSADVRRGVTGRGVYTTVYTVIIIATWNVCSDSNHTFLDSEVS